MAKRMPLKNSKESARGLVSAIRKRWPDFPALNLVGCTVQQLRNLYDSLEGRTPRLPEMGKGGIPYG